MTAITTTSHLIQDKPHVSGSRQQSEFVANLLSHAEANPYKELWHVYAVCTNIKVKGKYTS